MSKPKPKKYLESIKPYKGGVSKVDGIDKIFKLSSNENPFGSSLLAIEEYKKVSEELGVYPDSSNLALREMISKKYSLEIDRIICGCGSDEILHLLAKTYLNEGQEGLISENAFAVYPLAISASGAKVIRAKEKNFKPMVDNIISSVTKDTRIIYIANPNNPTGTLLKYEELEKTHRGRFHDANSLTKAKLVDILQELIDFKIGISPIIIDGKWCEIDTPHDLERARKIFKNIDVEWKKHLIKL